jgi:fatty-acyl-CoA synthase
MTSFNVADLFEQTASAVPERLAVVAGQRRLTYSELDCRSTAFARHLLSAGIGAGDHVAVMSWNRAEWLEVMLGCFKVRAVPVNVNYRYVDTELRYLLVNSDAVAMVSEAAFLPTVRQARKDLTKFHHLVVLEDESDSKADPVAGEADYEAALCAAPDHELPQRSGDDLHLLYTGGTTGSPKGVVWRSEDLYFSALRVGAPPSRPEDLLLDLAPRWSPWLVTSPLMHASGQWNSLCPLLSGLGVVLWTGHGFDAAAVARLVSVESPQVLVLIGDGMARPFVEEVSAGPERYDLSSVRIISSGGAILSSAMKTRLAEILPEAEIIDGFGASETGANGALMGRGGDGPPRFRMGRHTTVVDDELKPVEPGSGVVGKLAKRGWIPLGYYKDPERSAQVFPTGPDGTRWAIPGDAARLEADGTITIFGRGSSCINTGGEKVHPEEVEIALKAHPDVLDAFVIGVDDDRYGQRVATVIAPRAGTSPTLADLSSFLRPRLAGYKLPRQLALVEATQYTAPGKPDYQWARAQLVQSES